MNLRPQAKPKQLLLPEKDLRFLRKVARRTWRYFSDFVGDDTSWLPPDNYQVSPQNQLAMRTSPTNIGLWMLSALSAHDFGYMTVEQVVEKLAHTMETIGKLERYEGHLLNWCDVQTLTPLEPRYVSAVDSGNLLGALWSLEHGLDKLIQRPVLDGKAFEGLRDTGEILKQVVEQVSISNSIGSLRFLGGMDWREFVETMSVVEQTLREDPGGVYGKMDFATRDRYRHVVENIAKSSRLSESEVARKAIQLTREGAAKKGGDDLSAHVGFYLIDEGLVQLERLEARKGTDLFFSLPWSPLSSKFLNSPSIP